MPKPTAAMLCLALLLGASPPASDAPEPAPTGTIKGQIAIDADGALVAPRLDEAVVYLDAHPALDPPGPVEELEAPPIEQRPHVIQHERAFHPRLLVVANGTWVEFPNWDAFAHNVFSRSPAAPPFDMARYPHGRSKAYQFVRVGVVQVFCNIHPNMRATVVVTPNEHFARVDDAGRFTLEAVPLGDYELVVWHPRAAEARAGVTVAADDVAKLDLSLVHDAEENPRPGRQRQRRGDDVTRGLAVPRQHLHLPEVRESHRAWPGSAPEGHHHHHEAAH